MNIRHRLVSRTDALAGEGGIMECAPRERRTPRRTLPVVVTLGLVTVALAVPVILTAGLPASAETQTSVVSDPAGDARFKAPGFMDIVRVEVTKRGDTFEFRMNLVEPIPAVPPLPPPSQDRISWVWGLDTDPTTFPKGFPGAPGTKLQAEFVLRVDWDGKAFSALLIDRRPLLTGGEAVITPLPFTIMSSEVLMVVRAGELGSPTGFLWDAVTIYWPRPPGARGLEFVDFLDPFFNPWPS
jgi:hypothetical protein